ncbi:Ashwin [Trinorchestia longiramus]|nr:Ashwin [Trinorchestia longiramus]
MSESKRKRIVFDLDDSKNTKVPRCSLAGRTPSVQYSSTGGAQEQESTWLPFIQPETLTLSFMLETLEKCNVKLSSEVGSTRKEVEQLFLRHITSKPQRSHRSSRLGRALSQLQRLCTTSYTSEWHKLVKGFQATENTPSSSSLLSATPATSLTAATDRLKPPVQACINMERKTIKLGGAKKDTASLPTNAASLNKSLDKIDELLKPKTKSSPSSASINIDEGSKRVLSIKKSLSNTKKLKTESVSPTSEVQSSSTLKKHAAVLWP